MRLALQEREFEIDARNAEVAIRGIEPQVRQRDFRQHLHVQVD